MVLTIDKTAPAEVLAELTKQDEIVNVRALTL